MEVGIYDFRDPNGQDLFAIRAYEKILGENSIPCVRMRIDQPDFWTKLKSLTLFIMRFQQFDSDIQIARDLLPLIESDYKVKTYPNFVSGWHYDDKIKQYFLMRSHGFPMTQSWVFYDRRAALSWLANSAFPVVFKLRTGAGSQNVILVKSRKEASRLVHRMFGSGVRADCFLSLNAIRFRHFSLYRECHHILGNLYRWAQGIDISPYWMAQKNYVLFQRFLPGNVWDTRVTVIGGRAFAFRRMVRTDDFRASGSGRIDYETSQIDLRCVKIGFEVSRQLGFQSMAYDFLFNEAGEPEFCEISYAYVSRAIFDCPGYWDAELNWHPGHWWPEYFHLVDCLGIDGLRMPEISL